MHSMKKIPNIGIPIANIHLATESVLWGGVEKEHTYEKANNYKSRYCNNDVITNRYDFLNFDLHQVTCIWT